MSKTIDGASINPSHSTHNTSKENSSAGVLYVVSTPIGNLDDITIRGINQLKNVDVIACEDKRRSGTLLKHLGIDKPLLSYHEHSTERESEQILERIQQGESVALISDAGTPLIADPGYKLLQTLFENNVSVVPIPGVSAVITALSASGLPTDRFSFEGFLPAKREARRKCLRLLKGDQRTLVFYESPHRIIESLEDLCAELGDSRKACLAREVTKYYETFLRGTLSELLQAVQEDADQCKGEFVLMVEGLGSAVIEDQTMQRAEEMLPVLLQELSVKQASALVVRITGAKKNAVYQLALTLKEQRAEGE